MKTSTFVTLAIAAVPALARDGTTGIKYYGHTLINIGKIEPFTSGLQSF